MGRKVCVWLGWEVEKRMVKYIKIILLIFKGKIIKLVSCIWEVNLRWVIRDNGVFGDWFYVGI